MLYAYKLKDCCFFSPNTNGKHACVPIYTIKVKLHFTITGANSKLSISSRAIDVCVCVCM